MWTIAHQSVRVGAGFIPSFGMRELLELFRLMEEDGYDRIWCGNEKLYHDMWVTLGIISAHTKTLTVGTFVADPYSYHPALIAAAIATVSEATEGRAILLLGAGGFGFRELCLERVQPAAALEESVTLIRRLLAGETASVEGRVIQAKGAQLLFEPVYPTPIWVASRGQRVLEMAGRVADGVMLATHARPTGLLKAFESVKKGCRAVGRTTGALAASVRVDVCIDPVGSVARRAVKPMIAGMVKTSFPDQTFVRQAGLEIPERLTTLFEGASFSEVYAAAEEALPDEFVDAFSWAGSAEDVAGKVAAVLDAGFVDLCVVPHATASSDRLQVLHAFATEVLPRAKALLD